MSLRHCAINTKFAFEPFKKCCFPSLLSSFHHGLLTSCALALDALSTIYRTSLNKLPWVSHPAFSGSVLSSFKEVSTRSLARELLLATSFSNNPLTLHKPTNNNYTHNGNHRCTPNYLSITRSSQRATLWLHSSHGNGCRVTQATATTVPLTATTP